MAKELIRTEFKKKRRALTREEIRLFSEKISGHFLDYLEAHKEIQHIHLFLPIDRFHEVDTFPLYYTLKRKGYRIYTSVVNKQEDNLDTLDITLVDAFESDPWGIPVPVNAKKVAADQIQLVLIPLLAYDQRGFRLGYGKGYYDKYLASLKNNAVKIGLSFFAPLDKIPEESHDIPMDFCINPEGLQAF
ncbi:5-formyltetrahydrofolate cyclo-ligase [Cecembia rubra]|uniref:5-formyltetrahydrofolate cyclo-ligase n=1 Tax=Cecembia rubra TaxID=1485585 RepID=UPI002714CAF7|nr:5-formyltetrahydrofolate cyclo-ligase [Cecembia rubra]